MGFGSGFDSRRLHHQQIVFVDVFITGFAWGTSGGQILASLAIAKRVDQSLIGAFRLELPDRRDPITDVGEIACAR